MIIVFLLFKKIVVTIWTLFHWFLAEHSHIPTHMVSFKCFYYSVLTWRTNDFSKFINIREILVVSSRYNLISIEGRFYWLILSLKGWLAISIAKIKTSKLPFNILIVYINSSIQILTYLLRIWVLLSVL